MVVGVGRARTKALRQEETVCAAQRGKTLRAKVRSLDFILSSNMLPKDFEPESNVDLGL